MEVVDFKCGLEIISDFDDATINTCYETTAGSSTK
jgi:hypothetical protein